MLFRKEAAPAVPGRAKRQAMEKFCQLFKGIEGVSRNFWLITFATLETLGAGNTRERWKVASNPCSDPETREQRRKGLSTGFPRSLRYQPTPCSRTP